MIALTTDKAVNTYFDNLQIQHLDCFSDNFDSDKINKFKLKTNRFYERYKSDINLIWRQSENQEN